MAHNTLPNYHHAVDIYELINIGGLSMPSSNFFDHFRDGVRNDVRWQWAGSPFQSGGLTISTTDVSAIAFSGTATAANRYFYYHTLVGSPSVFLAGIIPVSNASGHRIMFRMDDGTDNNYYENGFQIGSSNYVVHEIIYRTGGGSVGSGGGVNYPTSELPVLYTQIGGTKWSNWSVNPLVSHRNGAGGTLWEFAGLTGLSWTPTRVGFSITGLAATWHKGTVDFLWY